MTEWKLRTRQSSCSACASAFVVGGQYVSVLSLRDDEFAREDVCVRCFESRDPGSKALHAGKDALPAGSDALHAGQDVFYWFTRHATDRRAVQLDLATLEQLFVQLESRSEQKLCEVRYLLCLLLMRKRRVKLERIVRGGDAGELMIVRRPRRQESLSVRVFDFDAERLGELRTQLRQIFDGTDFGVPLDLGQPAGAESSTEVAIDAASQK